jgi:hypothetical protein
MTAVILMCPCRRQALDSRELSASLLPAGSPSLDGTEEEEARPPDCLLLHCYPKVGPSRLPLCTEPRRICSYI